MCWRHTHSPTTPPHQPSPLAQRRKPSRRRKTARRARSAPKLRTPATRNCGTGQRWRQDRPDAIARPQRAHCRSAGDRAGSRPLGSKATSAPNGAARKRRAAVRPARSAPQRAQLNAHTGSARRRHGPTGPQTAWCGTNRPAPRHCPAPEQLHRLPGPWVPAPRRARGPAARRCHRRRFDGLEHVMDALANHVQLIPLPSLSFPSSFMRFGAASRDCVPPMGGLSLVPAAQQPGCQPGARLFVGRCRGRGRRALLESPGLPQGRPVARVIAPRGALGGRRQEAEGLGEVAPNPPGVFERRHPPRAASDRQ